MPEKIPNNCKMYDRHGKKCYRWNITFTFKHPTTHSQGMSTMASALQRTKSIVDVVLYPEFGSNANFHFHGTLWFTNYVHMCSLVSYWRQFYGFVKIQSVYKTSNQVYWHLYCRKDQWMYRQKKYPRINFKNLLKVASYYAHRYILV